MMHTWTRGSEAYEHIAASPSALRVHRYICVLKELMKGRLGYKANSSYS